MDIRAFEETSPLFGGNAPYIEGLYESWLADPQSVPEEWRSYFAGMQDRGGEPDRPRAPIEHAFAEMAKKGSFAAAGEAVDERTALDIARRQVAVQQLVAAYRTLGARIADLDPLHHVKVPEIPELNPEHYGLDDTDLDRTFSTANTFFGRRSMTLRDLVAALRQTYCGKIGAEYMHITDPAEKRWWQQRLESIRSTPSFGREERVKILEGLTASEGLEHYLHKKYVGQKRFSLEGGESFITAMDAVVDAAAEAKMREVVIGMAHRGRLNVLVNTMNRLPRDLFDEFEGKAEMETLPAGDVKYHNGFANTVATKYAPLWVEMVFNPSHLEAADAVTLGAVRAREDRIGDPQGRQILGILVHGDAAFSGQGVVQETLNLASTRGFGTGGTLHIVINNQIGFTTSDPRDKGSMLYCTDPAKATETPVIHVNGDDPESVALAARIAFESRLAFHRDVVLDIVCYRRLGHNEQDTPAVTQPLMYKIVNTHPTVREIYGKRLEANNTLEAGGADEMNRRVKERIRAGESPREVPEVKKAAHIVDWKPYVGHSEADPEPDTAVPAAKLSDLGRAFTVVPGTFRIHPLVERVIENRRLMAAGELPVDWGMAEHLAFASLLSEGHPVRITGEDSGRGTFSHRHAVLHDQDRAKRDEGEWVPLQHVAAGQAPFTVEDSPLSEYAVMGFEYGYASGTPDGLTIWEAQFGDFANTAQVIVDQFVTSGRAKWGRQNGLTLMLPHGYEGQGPEHSSARVERYLQLAADNNVSIDQPTTAAQIFHLLRRQVLRSYRKPLILFTPKSLLRNKSVSCPLSDLASGGYRTVIGDSAAEPSAVKRLILCSGRVYFDLEASRRERGAADVAIARVEELYPFPSQEIAAEMARYPNLEEVLWCQDEPQNQGPWSFVFPRLLAIIPRSMRLAYSGRDASSSPASGYPALHKAQLKALLDGAFGPASQAFPGFRA